MTELNISGGGIEAVVQLRGGMTTASFAFDGRRIDPFHRAPWEGFEGDPMLDRLRGDWLCAPFGRTPSGSLPEGWPQPYPDPAEWLHGYCANVDWRVGAHERDRVELSIDYPEGSDIGAVWQMVTCHTDGTLVIDHRIQARRDIDIPLGVHPTLRLPETVAAASLELPGCASIVTPPLQPEPLSRLTPGRFFTNARAAPACDGRADLTVLPWPGASEDLVLLLDVEEPQCALVNHEEGYRVRVGWDGDVLRHLMLWISNRGRPYEPWNGSNLCLGIEPVTSAFDLGTPVSQGSHPLSAVTTVPLSAGQELSMRHTVSVGTA